MSTAMVAVAQGGDGAESVNGRRQWKRAPLATLLLAAAAAMIYAMPGWASIFGYDRALTGQAWRLVTCHWAHWNGEHFLWSVGTFAVLGALCERENRHAFLGCLAAAAVAIPAVLWRYAPGLGMYGGLSGLDSALFVLLAAGLLWQKAQAREWGWVVVGAALVLLFFAKIGFEFVAGAPVFVSEDAAMNPVPLAHLVGGAVGGAVGWGGQRVRS